MIDINAFAGNWPFRPLSGATSENMLKFLKVECIKEVLVSAIEGIFYDEPQLANEKLYEAIGDFPSLIPVAVLNPKLSNWFDNLNICCEKYNIRSLKLHPNYHYYDLKDASSRKLLNSAGEKDIPVIIQLRIQDIRAQNPQRIVPDVNIADVIESARVCSETQFIIGGIRWGEATAKSKEIKKMPNLWLDISQIEYTDCLRQIIRIYGTNRLLFGTHAPFFVARSAIFKLKEANLSEEELISITSDNARELFGV